MAEPREKRLSPLSAAGDALLLLCALPGLTACFLSLYGRAGASGARMALDWAAAHTDQFLLLAALFALLSLGVWSLPRFHWGAAGGLAALWGLALWWNWRAVSAGAILVAKAVADLFAQRVAWGRTFEYDPGLTPSAQRQAVWLFLLFALALLALALGWAVVRARSWWVTALLTLPPLMPGLLADLFPDWLPFLALCACWCAMLLGALTRWAPPNFRGRLTLAALPAAALLLALITFVFPREGYTRPPWALKAQEELSNLANRMAEYLPHWENSPFHGTLTFVGSAGEADLAHAGPLNYTGRTVLRVRSDYDGRLYLRGVSLADYAGGVWTAPPEGEWQQFLAQTGREQDGLPLVLPALLCPDGETYTASINNVGAVGACVYAPYFLTNQPWSDLGMLPMEDSLFARLQGQWEHTVAFQDAAPASVTAPGAPPEGLMSAYSVYVYAHYLDVPEELRGGLEELVQMAWSVGLLGDAYMSSPSFSGGDTSRYARELGNFLSTFCVYDAEAEAAPEGTDPVLYFLNDSQRGYCMHYASAVTLMLRTMGIPARYVSGFTVQSVPNRQVTVPDRAAHAWVEVWVDGFGWYPVEVTPADAFAYERQPGADGSAAPATPGPTLGPELTDPPEPTPTPRPTPGPGQPGGPSGEGDGPDGALPTVLKALSLPAALIGLLWLLQFLLKRHRARQLADPDPNRAALYAYQCLERLSHWGGRIQPQAVELAEKAKYSTHTLTAEEVALLVRLVNRERTRLSAVLDWWQRPLFRYLWGMPKPPVLNPDL